MKNKIVELGISKRECEELIKVSKNIKSDYKKLLKGYPIQYLIGYSSFYGYKFLLNKHTLIPRYETEYLVEKTINYINKYFKDKCIHIIDLGTGSGCIAITLNKELNRSVVDAYDISVCALKMAKKNNKINNANVKFYRKNILKPINKKYDVIISNPPYVSNREIVSNSVHKYEPHIALYAKNNGLEFYDGIIRNSTNYTNKKSILAFEIGYEQAESIKSIAKQYYQNAIINVEKDLSGKDRYLFIINV